MSLDKAIELDLYLFFVVLYDCVKYTKFASS